MKESKTINNIAKLGDAYIQSYLTWDKDELENNWWKALLFFYSHSFMRGRRDELSNEYYYFTKDSLEQFFKISEENLDTLYTRFKSSRGLFDKGVILNLKEGKKNTVKQKDFQDKVVKNNRLIKTLSILRVVEVEELNRTYRKKIHLGNDEDIMMVLDVLKYVSEDKRKNIYKYLKELIIKKGAKVAYNELIKLRAIADKITTLIIRDIILLNPDISIKDYGIAFPVDTWVRRMAKKIGCKDDSDLDIKKQLIEMCLSAGENPLKFAAGLWFLGYRATDILIGCIDKIDIDSQMIQQIVNTNDN